MVLGRSRSAHNRNTTQVLEVTVKTLTYIKNRLLEASTWAGIGAAFAAGAVFYKEMIIGSVICGAIAVLMPDYTPNATK